MRLIIILSIILSGKLVTRAQLNFEGNPLTENTEYKAEESHYSGLNVKQGYQRFEVSDAREGSTTKGPSTVSHVDNVASPSKNISRTPDETRRGQVEDTSTSSSVSEDNMLERSSESLPNAVQDSQSVTESRQFREYPGQQLRLIPYQSTASQDLFRGYAQSQTYDPRDQALQPRNTEPYNSLPASPVTLSSSQALSEFLNSRTPEESQMALENYLITREQAARAAQKSGTIDDIQSAAERNDAQSGTLVERRGGAIMDEQETVNLQRLKQLPGVVSTKVVHTGAGQPSYSTVQQHAQTRVNHLDLQSKHNALVFAGPGRARYRGQLGGRMRVRPWAQARIDPRPFAYRHKGPVYGGPPGPPPGLVGKWKPPVEVIYTRPPGFGHAQSPLSNPPVPYEDASHWFPDADSPPPQKDVYYSQLYAQSYDPHYYNYIAKTGKIKPWLYGKLGKHEDKSIWWELFSGFKKHGMKNIMNPMFLLGMTIPTLTIMLSALVQKRSIGRSDSGGYVSDKLIDEYVQRLQRDIACYEKRLKDDDESKDKCW